MILLSVIFCSPSWAGRPVFHNVNLTQLTRDSDLIFAGWPSPSKQASPCGKPFGLWQINYVIKGDQNLRHKVVSVYGHGNHFYAGAGSAGKPVPSYAALKYGDTGAVSNAQRSTLMFLKKVGECYELTAAGGQEELSKEQLVRSIDKADDCRAQTEAIRTIIYKLPQDCSTDADCKGMTLHPHTCERPQALNINAESLLPAEWPALAARARTACAREWSKSPACAPYPMDTYCKAGRCQFGTIPPSQLSFKGAILMESCAPTDGPAMAVTFSDGDVEQYPRLGINWWDSSQPALKTGTYTLSSALGGKAHEGFSASYCKKVGSCAMIKELYLKIHVVEDGVGDAELNAITHDGTAIELKAPLKVLRVKKGPGRTCG